MCYLHRSIPQALAKHHPRWPLIFPRIFAADNPPLPSLQPVRAITRGHHPPLQSRHPGDLETIGVDWGTTSFTQSHPRVRHVSLTKKAYCAFWQFMVAISLVQHTAISPDHIKSFWQVIFSQSRFSHQFRQLNKMSRLPLIESTLQSQTYNAAMV